MADKSKNTENTVQVIPEARNATDSLERGMGSLVLQLANTSSKFIPFGRSIHARDEQLAAFWKTEPFLASAINSIAMTRASLSWELTGPPKSVDKVQKILKNSDFGRGWQSLISKVSLDLLQADNGAVMEIVRSKPRPGRSPETAPIIALNHLPSHMVTQTGNPETPAIYTDRNGIHHELKWYQVILLSEIPIPNEDNKNVQFCFVSRVLEMAETIKAVSNYQKEKVSGRFGQAIHVVSGVKQNDIEVIEKQAQLNADNAGLINYMSPIILSTIDPTAKVSKETIELAAYPDGFNYNELMTWYITLLALASGSDYMDFGPLPGKGLGTAAQSDSLAQKSRVKGILLFMKIIEHALESSNILPPNVSFAFANADATAEREQADIKKVRAETRKVQIEDGEITPEVARQMAVDSGDLSQEYLIMMGETENNTITIADDERVSEHILHPERTNLPIVKPEKPVNPSVADKAAKWIRRIIEEHPVQSAKAIPASQLQTFQDNLRNWLTKETSVGTDDVWLDYILIKACKYAGINPIALRHRMPDNYRLYVKSNQLVDSKGSVIYQYVQTKEAPRKTIKDILDKLTLENYPEMIKEVYELAEIPADMNQITKHLKEAQKLAYFSPELLKLSLIQFHYSLI